METVDLKKIMENKENNYSNKSLEETKEKDLYNLLDALKLEPENDQSSVEITKDNSNEESEDLHFVQTGKVESTFDIKTGVVNDREVNNLLDALNQNNDIEM